MGLANKSKQHTTRAYKHKQSNIFLFFPMYVCLGIYYILRFFALPVIWLWNASSTSIYQGVNKVSKENNEIRGAVMNGGEH